MNEIRLCKLCNSSFGVQNHHIIHGRGKRKQCETKQSQIDLCWECHHGIYGVEGREGHELDMKLKFRLQATYFEMDKTEDETRKLMGGVLYLKNGEIYKGDL